MLWSGLGLNMSGDGELITQGETYFFHLQSATLPLDLFTALPVFPFQSRLQRLLHQSPAPSLAPLVHSPPSSQSNLLKHKSDDISS